MTAPRFNTFAEGRAAFEAHRPHLEERGIITPHALAYVSEDIRRNWTLAMDAQPDLMTTPNSAIPAMLTTAIDPQVYDILFAPNKAAEVIGEQKRGTWLDSTALFPVVETAGEVSSYGDRSNNGVSTANMNWPGRQQYLYQTIIDYGEREVEMAGLGRVNWVAKLQASAALNMSKFENLAYFYGIASLENYGLLNDPGLTAALTPSTKVAGGTKWVTNGVVTATANEVFTDIQSMFIQLVNQNQGLVDAETPVTLALSPQSAQALTATNSFNVNVNDLLKKNFPNIKIVTAVQYGGITAANPQGNAAGELVQLIAEKVEGQEVGYCAFSEKLRGHNIVQALSSWMQKWSGGVWGAIIRQPMNIAQMVGV